MKRLKWYPDLCDLKAFAANEGVTTQIQFYEKQGETVLIEVILENKALAEAVEISVAEMYQHLLGFTPRQAQDFFGDTELNWGGRPAPDTWEGNSPIVQSLPDGQILQRLANAMRLPIRVITPTREFTVEP